MRALILHMRALPSDIITSQAPTSYCCPTRGYISTCQLLEGHIQATVLASMLYPHIVVPLGSLLAKSPLGRTPVGTVGLITTASFQLHHLSTSPVLKDWRWRLQHVTSGTHNPLHHRCPQIINYNCVITELCSTG